MSPNFETVGQTHYGCRITPTIILLTCKPVLVESYYSDHSKSKPSCHVHVLQLTDVMSTAAVAPTAPPLVVAVVAMEEGEETTMEVGVARQGVTAGDPWKNTMTTEVG